MFSRPPEVRRTVHGVASGCVLARTSCDSPAAISPSRKPSSRARPCARRKVSHRHDAHVAGAASLVASLRGASRLERRRWAAGEPYDDDDDDDGDGDDDDDDDDGEDDGEDDYDYSGGLMARSLRATVVWGDEASERTGS